MYRNWERNNAVSFLRIFVLNFRYSVFAVWGGGGTRNLVLSCIVLYFLNSQRMPSLCLETGGRERTGGGGGNEKLYPPSVAAC